MLRIGRLSVKKTPHFGSRAGIAFKVTVPQGCRFGRGRGAGPRQFRCAIAHVGDALRHRPVWQLLRGERTNCCWDRETLPLSREKSVDGKAKTSMLAWSNPRTFFDYRVVSCRRGSVRNLPPESGGFEREVRGRKRCGFGARLVVQVSFVEVGEVFVGKNWFRIRAVMTGLVLVCKDSVIYKWNA